MLEVLVNGKLLSLLVLAHEVKERVVFGRSLAMERLLEVGVALLVLLLKLESGHDGGFDGAQDEANVGCSVKVNQDETTEEEKLTSIGDMARVTLQSQGQCRVITITHYAWSDERSYVQKLFTAQKFCLASHVLRASRVLLAATRDLPTQRR